MRFHVDRDGEIVYSLAIFPDLAYYYKKGFVSYGPPRDDTIFYPLAWNNKYLKTIINGTAPRPDV